MSNRIIIFLHGQNGDILEASSVLKYRDELWGEGNEIIWYADKNNFDLLNHQNIEVREFPRGFGYPEMVERENRKLDGTDLPLWADWKPLVDEKNHLNIGLSKAYPELVGATVGYFPAPHQIPLHKRHNVQYSDCSKMVFGVPPGYEWHPVIHFSDEEIQKVKAFKDSLPNRKTVAIESFCGSGQSLLSDKQIRFTIDKCREILGECNFIFMSHKYLNGNEIFPHDILDMADVYGADIFKVRECGLLVGLCDLLISVSSGITVAASCWYNKDNNGVTPIIQFCGSLQCSTKSISLGEFHLITHDDKPMHLALEQYEKTLTELLNKIK